MVFVSATDIDPVLAARIANAYAREYIAFRRAADRRQIEETVRLLQRRLEALSPNESGTRSAETLEEQLRNLEILASLQTGNAELVQRGEAAEWSRIPATS